MIAERRVSIAFVCAGVICVGCASTAGINATNYRTDETPGAVLGAGDVEGVERALVVAGRESGLLLRGDGRLALLAGRFAGSPSPSLETLTAAARELGIVEPTLSLHTVAAAPELLAAALGSSLRAALSSSRPTHVGAFVHQDGRALAVVLSQRLLELAPVPRRFASDSLRVRGRFLLHVDSAKLEIIGREKTFALPLGPLPQFDVRVPTPASGAYRLRMLASFAERTQPVADLLVTKGVEPARVRQQRASSVQSDSTLLSNLWRKVALLRAEHNLRPLLLHPRLSAFARKRSAELAAAGSSAQREPEAPTGLSFTLVTRGADRDALLAALGREPAQREALTNSALTHVGIGLHETPEGALLVLALAALAQPFDATLAAAQLLTEWNEQRRARGASALRPDADLSLAAQRTAQALLANQAQDEQELTARSDAELARFGLAYRKVSTLLARVRDPREASALEPALSSEASAVGMAMVETERQDIAAPNVVIVVVLGFDR